MGIKFNLLPLFTDKLSTEDTWTPYKELQSLVERYVISAQSTHDPQYHEFMEALRNHRQNFLTLMKNPVSYFFHSISFKSIKD